MALSDSPTNRQALYREMVLGTLLYAVVLGFFNDYTDILETTSYSTTFLVAIVMQILTYLTFALKGKVVARYHLSVGTKSKSKLIFGVWSIMFVSKFVFLAVIDAVFGNSVTVSGFFGLLAIIVCLTVTQKIVELTDTKLGGGTLSKPHNHH